MASEPCLIMIDAQRAFDDPAWGRRNNPHAEQQIARLLEAWRANRAPLIHVRHRSRSPQGLFRGDAMAFKPEASPLDGETVIEKSVNSAFIGTDLEQRLRAEGIDTVVIGGFTTDHCCSTTARMGANLGFNIWFVADATATFDRRAPDGGVIDAGSMHRSELASLSGEFAEILQTSEVIDRLKSRS